MNLYKVVCALSSPPDFSESLTILCSELSICVEIVNAFGNATQYANKWAKAWHQWALFNTAVMSHYTLRGYPSVAAQFVVAAVTGYFHSIACAANAKGVDDSLQVNEIPSLALL